MVRNVVGVLLCLLVGASNGFMVSAAFAASPTISWTDNSNNETGFNCYRRAAPNLPEVKVCTVGANILTCSSSEQGQIGYCYQCTAFNSLGESTRSNAACWTVPAGPSGITLSLP